MDLIYSGKKMKLYTCIRVEYYYARLLAVLSSKYDHLNSEN